MHNYPVVHLHLFHIFDIMNCIYVEKFTVRSVYYALLTIFSKIPFTLKGGRCCKNNYLLHYLYLRYVITPLLQIKGLASIIGCEPI